MGCCTRHGPSIMGPATVRLGGSTMSQPLGPGQCERCGAHVIRAEYSDGSICVLDARAGWVGCKRVVVRETEPHYVVQLDLTPGSIRYIHHDTVCEGGNNGT